MSANQPDVALNDPSSRTGAGEDLRGGWPWFGRARWLLVLSGILAGAVAFGIGEKTHNLIPVESHPTDLQGSTVMQSDWKDRNAAATKNGAITYAVLGLCLGAGLGIAGGIARRSAPRAAVGGVLGAILSAGLGSALAWLTLPWFLEAQLDHDDLEMLVSLGMHALHWGILGACAGLTFMVALGEYRQSAAAMVSGLIGAVLGTLAYDLIGGGLLPMAGTDHPIAETWPARLLACMLVSLGTALAVATVGLPDRARAANPNQAGFGVQAGATESSLKDSPPRSDDGVG